MEDVYVHLGSSVGLFSLFTGNVAVGQKVLLMDVWVIELFSLHCSTTRQHLRAPLPTNPHTLNIRKARFSNR